MAPQRRKGLIAAAADVVLGNKEVRFLFSVDQSLCLFSLCPSSGTSCLRRRFGGTLRLPRVRIYRKVWKTAASSLLTCAGPWEVYWLVTLTGETLKKSSSKSVLAYVMGGARQTRGHVAPGRDNVTFKFHYFSKWENNHKWADLCEWIRALETIQLLSV